MGREDAKEQSKAAQREKEQAAFAKKQERRDKVWEQGAKDTSKETDAAAKDAAAADRKATAVAQAAAEDAGTSELSLCPRRLARVS